MRTNGTHHSDLFDRLRTAHGKPGNGSTGYKTDCPACQGKGCLSIRETPDGGAFMKCHHASCTLSAKKLFAAVLDDAGIKLEGERAPLIEYRYIGSDQAPFGHSKVKRPKYDRRPTDKGKAWWSPPLNGKTPPLYGVHELPAAIAAGRPIHIVEGEGKRDALVRLGFAAVSIPHGGAQGKLEGKWRGEWNPLFKGASVVVIADADPTGINTANHIAQKLRDVAAEVRVIVAPDPGDIEDAIAFGLTGEDLVALIERATPGQLLAIETAAPAPVARPAPAPDEPLVRWANEVEQEALEWIADRGWFPRVGVALCVGPPAAGKTTLLGDLAASLSRGESWPSSRERCEPVASLFWTTEDSAGRLRARFDAAHADLSRISIVEAMSALDFDWLERVIRERNIGLVVLDPITDALGIRDADSEWDVRSKMVPLMGFSRRLRVLIVGVRHGRKSAAATAADRILGSVAWRACTRCAIGVDKYDGGILMARVKGNDGRDPEPLTASLLADGPDASPYLQWNGEAGLSSQEVDDILSGRAAERDAGQARGRPEFEKAVAAFEAELGDGEWHPQAEVSDRLKNHHHVSERIARQAREHLRVQHDRREEDGTRKKTSPGWWRLPSAFEQATR